LNWTKQFRKTRPGAGRSPERVSWPDLILMGLLLAGVGFIYAYPRLKEPPLIRRDFVGRVLDKSLTLRESQIGTGGFLTLLVEDRGGGRFKVLVTEEQYERARVGMWVERSGGEIKLSWDEPEPGAARGGNKVDGR
jgi:hypothetical protein